ncbi:TRL-like family protein [Desulfobacterales bacterium HSG16]|nr:TRL-like family protein [Desulfobacterales bacterium HSG16]
MMKNSFLIALAIACGMMLLTGCTTNAPPGGLLFTGIRAPDAASTEAMRTGADMNNVAPRIKGQATCIGILGLVAIGDCSIQAAMQNGGISKVHHVDYKTVDVLGGMFHSLTTVIYGK